MPTMTQHQLDITGGVDTHKDTHTAAALDSAGRVLGDAQFPATPAGYAALLCWLNTLGRVVQVGVEGTGVYGAGLARFLRRQHVDLVEIDRPDRRTRRRQGKFDPVDAVAAARAALAAQATGIPKHRDGRVEALRNLRVARRCAVAHRADIQRRMHALIVTAPDDLRQQLRALTPTTLPRTCAALRPDTNRPGDPATAAKIALKLLARQHLQLSQDITELDEVIAPLVNDINPQLLAAYGVGPDVAGQLLVTAGDNPDRLRSEAAFAMLCGTAPLPASSGKTHRHRLNRGGDRHANNAIWRIVITRLAGDPRTRAYRDRRITQGLSKPEIIRCLKRYVTREIYQLLNPTKDPQATT